MHRFNKIESTKHAKSRLNKINHSIMLDVQRQLTSDIHKIKVLKTIKLEIKPKDKELKTINPYELKP